MNKNKSHPSLKSQRKQNNQIDTTINNFEFTSDHQMSYSLQSGSFLFNPLAMTTVEAYSNDNKVPTLHYQRHNGLQAQVFVHTPTHIQISTYSNHHKIDTPSPNSHNDGSFIMSNITTLEHKSRINAIFMEDDWLIAALHDRIIIYKITTTFSSLEKYEKDCENVDLCIKSDQHLHNLTISIKLYQVVETAENPAGLFAYKQGTLVVLGKAAIGQIEIISLPSKAPSSPSAKVVTIQAHITAIQALSLSPQGRLLVTASETGTMIRAHSTVNGEHLGTWRRGREARKVHCVGICGGIVVACSDAGTLHAWSHDFYDEDFVGEIDDETEKQENFSAVNDFKHDKNGELTKEPKNKSMKKKMKSSISSLFSSSSAILSRGINNGNVIDDGSNHSSSRHARIGVCKCACKCAILPDGVIVVCGVDASFWRVGVMLVRETNKNNKNVYLRVVEHCHNILQ